VLFFYIVVIISTKYIDSWFRATLHNWRLLILRLPVL